MLIRCSLLAAVLPLVHGSLERRASSLASSASQSGTVASASATSGTASLGSSGTVSASPSALPSAAAHYYNRHSHVDSWRGIERPKSFVKRHGNKLTLNGKLFTPVGVNAYWLALDENLPGHKIGYPSQQRVRELYAINYALGGNVVRAQSVGFSFGSNWTMEPKLDHFNEKAFRVADYAVYAAGFYGQRLILPLADNYNYFVGGRFQFLNWTGVPASQNASFFTNEPTIRAFERWITKRLTRRNIYSGIRLKDDPNILAIQTGNEWGAYGLKEGAPPRTWTTRIAKHIKKVAGKHMLVIDGSDGLWVQANGTIIPGLSIPEVDIVSDHQYPLNALQVATDLGLGQQFGKVVLIDEYDWTELHGGSNLTTWLERVERSYGVGDVMWSMFGRNDDCTDYIYHNDGYSVSYPLGNATLVPQLLKLAAHWSRQSGRRAPRGLPSVACPQPQIPLGRAAVDDSL